MNKKELIEAVAEQADLPKSKAELAVNAFLHATQDALVRGESVQLIGFGTFAVADRAARKGRNPQTGQEIEIPASRVPQFKAGAKLKESVNA
ncbi:HU family DNA-binding protein [Sansalvadorimonas verongulae]|uniref:HU family DNA-binding protein n=1 Tax=Sansalvadorimonas verongulae TaxID=2172824 RepID=UPI0012BB7D36|nr:HU family DNA-binding protein [Sansalvadorimonas verongulae]MTI12836.1 HU family DNA-binding protein [Sansalvadorimonas verongulae]